MSGDEIIALIGSIFLGFVGWRTWLGGLFFLGNLSRKPATQFLGWVSPVLAGAAVLFVLCRWSSHDVRDDRLYIFFYMAMGFGWTGLWNLALPYAGLSFVDDALERNNTAAGVAMSGGLFGVALAFAGGNIGNGPGWWVVAFCAVMATAALLLLWMINGEITRSTEAITVDRDMATGWRTAGFFVGGGLILGRAVAGDWHSTQETVNDFIAKGWPVLILWGILLALDIIGRPTPQRPVPNQWLFGVLPALLLVLIGIADVIKQGPWQ